MDTEELREQIKKEVSNELKQLASLPLGSKEHMLAVADICKLYDRELNQFEANVDYSVKQEHFQFEQDKFERECEIRERSIANDEVRVSNENETRQKQFETEIALRNRQFELESLKQTAGEIDTMAEKILKGIDIGVRIAAIIMPLSFYSRWMEAGFKFEEEGTFTSTTFRGLFSKFKPTKLD